MAVGAAAFDGLALLRAQKCQVLLRGTNAFPFDFREIGVLKPSCKCVLLSLTPFNAFHFQLDHLVSLVFWGEMRRLFFSVHPFPPGCEPQHTAQCCATSPVTIC